MLLIVGAVWLSLQPPRSTHVNSQLWTCRLFALGISWECRLYYLGWWWLDYVYTAESLLDALELQAVFLFICFCWSLQTHFCFLHCTSLVIGSCALELRLFQVLLGRSHDNLPLTPPSCRLKQLLYSSVITLNWYPNRTEHSGCN